MSVQISGEWRDKLMEAGFPMHELRLGVAEEILRRLPFSVEHKFKTANGQMQLYVSYITLHREKEGWQVCLKNSHRRPRVFWKTDTSSLANAAAAMWIYLKEHNLLPQK